MNARRRRAALRAVTAVLTLAIAPAWVIGRIRAAMRRQLQVPALDPDGKPLSRDEFAALAGIAGGYRHTAPEPGRSP